MSNLCNNSNLNDPENAKKHLIATIGRYNNNFSYYQNQPEDKRAIEEEILYYKQRANIDKDVN